MIYSNSDRTFQSWDYDAGHGSLLIRAPMGSRAATNIDLIFLGVSFVRIPRYFGGIAVAVGGPDDGAVVSDLVTEPLRDMDTVYVITSGDQKYYVVAAGLKIDVNDRGYSDIAWKDALLPWRGESLGGATSDHGDAPESEHITEYGWTIVMNSSRDITYSEEPPVEYPWCEAGHVLLDGMREVISSLRSSVQDLHTSYYFQNYYGIPLRLVCSLSSWGVSRQGKVNIQITFSHHEEARSSCTDSSDDSQESLVAEYRVDVGSTGGPVLEGFSQFDAMSGEENTWILETSRSITSFFIDKTSDICHYVMAAGEWYDVEEGGIQGRKFEEPMLAALTLTTRDWAVDTLIGLQCMMYRLLRLVGDQRDHVNVASLFSTDVRDFHPTLPSESVTVDLSRRAWRWLAAGATGMHTIRLLLSFQEWLAPWDDLRELLTIANVTQIDFLPPGHPDNPWGQQAPSSDKSQTAE